MDEELHVLAPDTDLFARIQVDELDVLAPDLDIYVVQDIE